MAVKTVNVTYNGEGQLELEQDKSNLELGIGDQVRWHFQGDFPLGCFPFIFFQDQTDYPLGPFQYLEPSASGVLGIGNNGVLQDYPYIAMLLNQEGAVATSAPAIIRNFIAPEDTSPDAVVSYQVVENSPRLQVTPSALVVERGRMAVWRFKDIPVNCFVTFNFPGYPDPMKGPFLSISWSRDFNGSWLANGQGLLSADSSRNLAPIIYNVQLRDEEGKIVPMPIPSNDDPVIEPLESPPGT